MFGRRPDADSVVSGLWLGSQPTSSQAKKLAGLGIDTVVDLRAEAEPVAWPDTVEVRRIPWVDHAAPSLEQLSSAAELVSRMLRDGKEVLVHCRAGMERSPTVVCAVLVLQGWTLREAYKRVTQARSGILPTPEQMHVLEVFASARPASPAELV